MPQLPACFTVGDWRSQIDRFTEFGPFVVVIDSYLATRQQILRLDQISEFSVAVDDYDRLDYPTDLVINPNPFFEHTRLPDDFVAQRKWPRETGRIGGPNWVLIRE